MRILLDLEERIENYRRDFPKYPSECLYVYHGSIWGGWYIGRSREKQEYYGQYPGNYLQRVGSLFPDRERVLHLFSGVVDRDVIGGVTFDIDHSLSPDVVGDVRDIRSYFDDRSFDLVVADPPYDKADFEEYGQKPFSKRQALRDIEPLLVHGGFLVWLDLRIPPFSKAVYDRVGTVFVLPGTNAKVRVMSIFTPAREDKA